MERHYTPKNIAKLLTQWVPKHISNILEPAVGNGSLVLPLIKFIAQSKCSLYCNDIDKLSLELLKVKLHKLSKSSINIYNFDFLSCSNSFPVNLPNSFDCIIMNPPFCGKKKDMINLKSLEYSKDCLFPDKIVTIEEAFLFKALTLLKPNGRILAILPSSFIAGYNSNWFRKLMVNNYSVICSHELSPYTFKSLDVTTYLFVFEKSKNYKTITLANHALFNPEHIKLNTSTIGKDYRLDFSFQFARLWHNELRNTLFNSDWKQLSEFTTIFRGSSDSTRNKKHAIHSTDFENGFWKPKVNLKPIPVLSNDIHLQSNDILLKRVGRHCTFTFGFLSNFTFTTCTDCMLIIRPHKGICPYQVLFSLRCLLSHPIGNNLVSRGSYAKYIVQKSLNTLHLPLLLNNRYPKMFEKYVLSVKQHQFDKMLNIERSVRLRLFKHTSFGDL